MMMMLVVCKSEYIYNGNNVLSNLRKYEDIFELQSRIIGHAKCYLLQDDNLEDFMVDGIYVSVYRHSNSYELYFDDYVMSIDTYDRQIMDYSLSRK